MKKIISVLLVLIMALSMFAACGQSAEPAQPQAGEETQEVNTYGMLTLTATSEDEISASYVGEEDLRIMFFDGLSSLLLALESGKLVKAVGLPDITCQYIVAHNPKIALGGDKAEQRGAKLKYYMGVLEENEELYKELENAVKAMTADGTFESLEAEYIDTYLNSEINPEPVDLPVIDGADTIRVAVTGDLPPLDFVAPDGRPAGYNVAVLSEISSRIGKNIELVTLDSGARIMSLSSGSVDALFWVCQRENNNADLGFEYDNTDGILLTSPYFETSAIAIKLAE